MDTNFKIFFKEIIKEESQKINNAEEIYGEYFLQAIESSHLLYNFITSITDDGAYFNSFLGQIQKHALLSIISAIREHDTESKMNLRQVLEAGIGACYSIENNDISEFINQDNDGKYKLGNTRIGEKHYKWIENNYKEYSDFFHRIKKFVNNKTHVNIKENRNITLIGNIYINHFFDKKDDYNIKINLWNISSTILNTLDLIVLINNKKKVITFDNNFKNIFIKLADKNIKLKKELFNL